MQDPMQTVSFKLPKDLNDALSDLARRRRSSRSAVVREALEAYAKGGRTSVTQLAADLIGGPGGPADLSMNPKYMDDYGR